jgi:hypothetical protein
MFTHSNCVDSNDNTHIDVGKKKIHCYCLCNERAYDFVNKLLLIASQGIGKISCTNNDKGNALTNTIKLVMLEMQFC